MQSSSVVRGYNENWANFTSEVSRLKEWIRYLIFFDEIKRNMTEMVLEPGWP